MLSRSPLALTALTLASVLSVACGARQASTSTSEASHGALAPPSPVASAPPKQPELRVTDEARCFFQGKWYERGSETYPTSGRRCTCADAPEWSCHDQSEQEILSAREKQKTSLMMLDCPSWKVLPSDRGSSALSADRLAKLRFFAEEVEWTVRRKPRTRVVLEAHANPTEEPMANDLAQRRAEAVRDVLVSAGVDRNRIEIRNLGTARVPASNPWLPICTPIAEYDPGAKVVFWWEW